MGPLKLQQSGVGCNIWFYYNLLCVEFDIWWLHADICETINKQNKAKQTMMTKKRDLSQNITATMMHQHNLQICPSN